MTLSLALVAGCGGDDEDPSTISEDVESNDNVDDIAEAIDDGLADDIADASGIDEECLAVALEFQQAFGEAGTALADPGSLDDFADTFERLGDRLPDLADEFDTIADAFEDAASGNYDALDSAEYEAASTAVGDYFDENCSAE